MTSIAETDNFGFVSKKSATLGGLQIVWLCESGAPHTALRSCSRCNWPNATRSPPVVVSSRPSSKLRTS
jgi:hypothetical protein